MNHVKSILLFISLLSVAFLAACTSEQPVTTNPTPTHSPFMGDRLESSTPAIVTNTPQPTAIASTGETPSETTPGLAPELVTKPDAAITEEDPANPPTELTEPIPISLDGSWLWATVTDPIAGRKSISNPRNYRVFIQNNTLSLITNCNFTPGSITYDDDNISIILDESAFADCPLEEQQFISKLNSAKTFNMNNGRLLINLAGSDNVLELRVIDDSLPPTLDSLLSNLQDPFHQYYCDAPAAILLLDTPEGPFFDTYGFASLEQDFPIDATISMEMGDITNSFTSVIILQLQEEGLLSLDDSLSEWLPNTSAQIPNREQITLRHLAQNRSGIPDYTNSLIQPAIDNIDRNSIQEDYSPQELVNLALTNVEEEPPFAPGEGWQDSATNYILLGIIAEQATGQPLAELYQERIFTPLGMTSSFLPEGIPEDLTVSQGYYTVDNELVNFTDWNTSQGWAGGGIISTAEDMSKYIRGLFNGELFQSVFTLGEMVDFIETDNSSGQYEKYGLGIGQFANDSLQAWGHSGQTPGFTTSWIYVPESDTTAVLLTNSGSCTSLLDLPMALTSELFGLTSSPTIEDLVAPVPEVEPDNTNNSCAQFALPYPRPEPSYETKLERDLSAYSEAIEAFDPVRLQNLDELLANQTVLGIQTLIDNGRLTSEELVIYYLNRIQTYDIGKLNSVMALNPEAITSAQALDTERTASGAAAPLHGIPVLLKDNIATDDDMPTTAGAVALQDWQASQDAFLVQQLRDAGAIILGKSNLSEWANWMDACMPHGFSTLGGQTRNPYGAFDVGGSSSGSAAAIAANLATISVGTETQGSLILPASNNSVVGLKPSMGLISRDNVIPLLPAQDMAGPIGRSVTDVAVLLTALAGVDDNDPVTQDAAALAGTDFTQFLSPEAAAGLRVGIVIIDEEAIQQTAVALNFSDTQLQTYRKAVTALNETSRQTGQLLTPYGIEIVEISSTEIPSITSPNGAIEYGFKEAINQFLLDLDDEAPAASLEAIIAFNEEDLTNRAPYGQSHLLQSQNTPITADEFATILEENQETAVTSLNAIFQNADIDVLISSVGQAYAPAGFPAITIPNGYDATGKPQGIVFVGDYLSEPQLLTVAYLFEQATQARVAPNLTATMQQIEQVIEPSVEETEEVSE